MHNTYNSFIDPTSNTSSKGVVQTSGDLSYRIRGKEFYHFILPPKIPTDLLPLMENELPNICIEKLNSLKERDFQLEFKRRQYNLILLYLEKVNLPMEKVVNFMKKVDLDEELFYLNKWIVYWETIRRRCLKLEIPQYSTGITEEEIVTAKAYPFEALLGGKMKVTCPFHEERTASFSVFRKQNYGKCFGCNWWGDTIDFVMKTEELDFPTAVRRLNGLH